MYVSSKPNSKCSSFISLNQQEIMEALLGLVIIAGQVRWSIIMFWWHKDAPKRLKICIGICLLVFLLWFIGMANEM